MEWIRFKLSIPFYIIAGVFGLLFLLSVWLFKTINGLPYEAKLVMNPLPNGEVPNEPN